MIRIKFLKKFYLKKEGVHYFECSEGTKFIKHHEEPWQLSITKKKKNGSSPESKLKVMEMVV